MGLDRIEAKLFRAYWDDGLLDVFCGLGVVGIGVCWLVDLVPLGALLPATLIPMWGPLRKRWVEPRAGLVEFSEARSSRNRRFLRSALWLGVGALCSFLSLFWWLRGARAAPLLPSAIPALPAVLVACPAALTAFALGLPRFLGHAGILVACGIFAALADAEPGVSLVAGGALVTIAGARLLASFLQLPTEEEEAE